MSDTNNTTRIAKNTLALYVQMFFSMLVGLYTSRVILNVLGVEDFGILNVVGGVVAMFGILNSAMSSSTSRFITFELGHKDIDRQRSIFSTALIIHIALALLICVVAEPVGTWFMQTQLNIPDERMEAALWVFHASVITIFFSIINVPYSAAIIAHEKMSVFAYFSILDISLKLAIVFLLQEIDFDKLKIYAVLLLCTQLLMQFITWIYCFRNFAEVRGAFRWNKAAAKEMSSFAGWSMFGDSAVLMFTQGVNILLNMFFGAPVNAARGIATQVQGVVTRFIGGFQTALNPQIIKSYAVKDLVYMHKLIYASSKFSFFLLLMLSLPVFLEAQNLLTWWLKIVPEHTINFVRIMMCISLVDSLANPLIFSAKATGKIKRYQATLGTLLLLVVPVSYLFLWLGYAPESVFVVHLVITILGQVLRVVLIRPMIDLSLRGYMNQVVVKCATVLVLAPILPLVPYFFVTDPIWRLLLIIIFTLLSVSFLVYTLAMNSTEKAIIKDLFYKKLRLNKTGE
ncbi:lipopolysaccharide biosynthesis protein [Sphingobacterium alkalisoli]|uniref:Lipopolysaccharide biosynthesis protein n=1 Tax=Sphingobacterium alkalisoli TaxID=1874115 RepID=A0A4U0GN30_9SPHI|nr:lipopolysaccharide biosynthesis protein [Sphingobacterium alkalisoli]TJY60143.1 lipopolysaccharide biosynthesis protein [Sphingobacterium alkalisoli]GGH32186.1 hypothetical protein GCM10011418_45550 [Sphingobacterium alkalisoli]